MKELFSATTGESFDTYIDVDKNLIILQPPYLIGTNLYTLQPNTNSGKELNNFYAQFPNGVEGTLDFCKEQANIFKK